VAGDVLRRASSRFAVAIAVAVILVALFSFVIWVAGGLRTMPVAFGRTPVGVFGLVLSPICYAAVGGVLAAVVPRNPVGWILLAGSIALGSILPVNLLVASVHEALRPPSTLVVWLAWARTAFASPVLVPLLVIAALLFPDGRSVGPRWRWAIPLTALGGALLVLSTALDPRGLWSYPSLPNPTALPDDLGPLVDGVRVAAAGLLVACIGLAVASLVLRYRRGDGLARAQLRWIVVAAAVTGAAALPYVAARYVVEVDESTGELAAAIAQIGSAALPLAAAFAISRYRLFQVDVLIGRTLVYLPLMGMLGGLYTAGIAFFQRLFVTLTGETSDLAAILAIPLVATAFTPLRKLLESAVDRRFPAHGPGHPGDQDHAAGTAGLRLSAFEPARAVPAGELTPVEPSGLVHCPLNGPKALVDCLGCDRLRAVVAGPTPAVVCQLSGGDAPPPA